MLAEAATPVDQIDVDAAQRALSDARDDLGMLKPEDAFKRDQIEKNIRVQEEMIEAAQQAA